MAFAGNSIVCRGALADRHIDPVGFTLIRLVAGALTLSLLSWFAGNKETHQETPATTRSQALLPAISLFVYAIAFSFAYVSIDAGVGALLLFGAVQATMLLAAVRSQESLTRWQWIGLASALGGLAYLVLSPAAQDAAKVELEAEASAQAVLGAGLMLIAGVAWGAFTLLGRNNQSALRTIHLSFVWTIPVCLLLGILASSHIRWDSTGFWLATFSGAVTSGLGYALWYRVLPYFSRAQAAILQLLVPVIAAVGGILVLGEQISLKLVIGSLLVLGGVLLSILMSRKVGR